MSIHRSCAVAILALTALIPNLADAAPIGSYNIELTPPANAGSSIRITAVAEDGTRFDTGSLTVSGLNANQIRDLVKSAFAGWSVTDLGDNGLTIRGAFTGVGTAISPIKQVDGGQNAADPTLKTNLDGNVTTAVVKPGDTWKVGFAPGLETSPFANVATLDLGPFGLFETVVAKTPSAAALDFFTFLEASGFPDVELLSATNQVGFFLAPSGDPIGSINAFAVSGSDLHYSLEIPSEVPEPATLALLGAGVLGLVGVVRLHRRAAMD